MKHILTFIASALIPLLTSEPTFGQYERWQHHGSLVLLTTPDGAGRRFSRARQAE